MDELIHSQAASSILRWPHAGDGSSSAGVSPGGGLDVEALGDVSQFDLEHMFDLLPGKGKGKGTGGRGAGGGAKGRGTGAKRCWREEVLLCIHRCCTSAGRRR